jgi:hypothetical protein
LEESWAAKEAIEARAIHNNEEVGKCKNAYSSQHYFPEFPLEPRIKSTQ